MINPQILERLDELIREGEQQWLEFQKTPRTIKDPVRFTQWTTRCLNLLDRLSISTNRFVVEFESWAKRAPGREINLGAALGILKSAREEYVRGFASTTIFPLHLPYLETCCRRLSTFLAKAIYELQMFSLEPLWKRH